MPQRPATQAPAPQASIVGVATAIDRLSKADFFKLHEYAKRRIDLIGRAAESRDADDLVQEAINLTLEGKRSWNSAAVDVVGHLIGVMKSVSSHWAEEVRRRGATTYVESEVSYTREERPGAPVDTAITRYPSTTPSADRQLVARSEVEQIRQAFADDSTVTRILDQMAAGVTDGPSIRAAVSLSQTEFETARRRLKRKADALRREG